MFWSSFTFPFRASCQTLDLYLDLHITLQMLIARSTSRCYVLISNFIFLCFDDMLLKLPSRKALDFFYLLPLLNQFMLIMHIKEISRKCNRFLLFCWSAHPLASCALHPPPSLLVLTPGLCSLLRCGPAEGPGDHPIQHSRRGPNLCCLPASHHCSTEHPTWNANLPAAGATPGAGSGAGPCL